MNIKYDMRTKKVLLISMIAALLLFAAGFIVMWFEIMGLELLFLFGIYVGGGLFICSALNFVASLCYFKRLKRHGYEIPYNRKDYGNDLRNLPVSADADKEIPQDSKESRILGIFYGVTYLLSTAWNIYYIVSWYRYVNGNAVFLLCVQIILDLVWIIEAIILYGQMDSKKYRDDVEADLSKKERTSIEKGLLTGLIILVMTIFVKSMAVNMSEYVYKAMSDKEQSSNTIEDVQSDGR